MSHFDAIRQIMVHAINAVRPEVILANKKLYDFVPKFRESRNTIKIQDDLIGIDERNVHVVGFGKAVLGMAKQLHSDLGPNFKGGILSTPVSSIKQYKMLANSSDPEHFHIHEGALHNLPDEAAHRAAKCIVKLVSSLTSNDVLIVLVSGGGSALLPMPRPPLTVSEKSRLIRKLSNSGASITEMNIVRIALSKVKGNRLALAGHNAHLILTLVISDVIGDPMDIMASGPTIPMVDRQMNPRDVMKKYNMYETLPKHVKAMIDERLPIALRTQCPNSFAYLVGNNKLATQAAELEAKNRKYESLVLTTSVQGDVQEVAANYIKFMKTLIDFENHKINEEQLKKMLPFYATKGQELISTVKHCIKDGRSTLFIAGGEPTVKVTGGGQGGRNQELALRMSLAMYEDPDLSRFIFLSAGTDGQDGPTPVAGAIGGDFVIQKFLAAQAGRSVDDVRAFIIENDSYNFYKNLLDGTYHINTGYTGTNVMDLHFLLLTDSQRHAPYASHEVVY